MNVQCILTSRPAGIVQAENFTLVESAEPALGDRQILIRNRFLSVEPSMRHWIANPGLSANLLPLGSVMRSIAVGDVIESRHPDYREGEILTGWFGWQELAAVDSDAVIRRVTETDLPISLALGILGLNGITAYLALTGIGEPKAGETVVVSTAAGAVGSAAGQIAKIMGCRTIGITGTAAKEAKCREIFGFDATLNYRKGDISTGLGEICPLGVDVYFDNTAGWVSDAVLAHLAVRGRVVLCGTASVPQWHPWPLGPRVERHLLLKRARMQGFVIFDHLGCWDTSVARLAEWVRQGSLVFEEDIRDGIDECPDAIACLYRGENLGKLLIRL